MVLRVVAAATLTAAVAIKLLLDKLGIRLPRNYGDLEGIVSFSSLLIAAARAVESQEQHRLVHDPLAAALAGPEAIATSRKRTGKAPKGSGRKTKISMMAIRTKWFDDQIEAALCLPVEVSAPAALVDDGAPTSSEPYIWRPAADAHMPHQVVMLGSGMDSRPWRMKLPAELKWFEIDRADVLAAKRRMLVASAAEVPDETHKAVAGQPTSPLAPSSPLAGGLARQISLDKVELPLRTGDWAGVAADLSSPAWAELLKAAGFDPHKPTVWVAEGLLMYLEPQAVQALLRQAAALSAPGSSFLCVSVTNDVISDIHAKGSRSELLKEWKFGIDADSPGEFFARHGWQLQLATDRQRMARVLRLRPELCTFGADADHRRASRSLFMVATLEE